MQPEPRRWGLLCGALLGSLSLLIACLLKLIRRRQPTASSLPTAVDPHRLTEVEARLADLGQRQLALAANLEQANLAFRRLAARLDALSESAHRPPSDSERPSTGSG